VALERQHLGQVRGPLAQAIEQTLAIGFQSQLPVCLNGLAGLAVLHGDLVRAARLYGAVEGLAERFGLFSRDPALRVFDEQHQADLRERLDAAALGMAWQEGQRMSMEEAVGYGLSDQS
jgi:hypothetical protein